MKSKGGGEDGEKKVKPLYFLLGWCAKPVLIVYGTDFK